MKKKCRSCKGKLKHILSLGQQYLSDFVPNEQAQKTPKFPLNLERCMNCGLVQLGETTPAPYLYNDHYGYKSGINQMMREELKDIVDRTMEKIELKRGDVWIECGANDGTLLSFCPEYVIKVAVEPIKKLAEESKKYADIIINDFWGYDVYEKEVTEKKLSDLSKRNSAKILSQSKELD